MLTHEGHRDRLRKRLQKTGMDSFEPHEMLELLLTYVIPRRDTNPIAHALINRFGSVYRVLNASANDLLQVDGVGEYAVSFLNMLPQLFRCYMISSNEEVSKFGILSNSTAVYEYISPYFIGRKVEIFYLICLTNIGSPINAFLISEGEVNYTTIDTRKIMEVAINSNASAVIMCHNHPDGIAEPSQNDIVMTNKVMSLLNSVNIALIDHIIIAGDDFVSFNDTKLISNSLP